MGNPALVIDAFKRLAGEERMKAAGILKNDKLVARISRAMNIPRSAIYCSRNEESMSIKPRVSGSIKPK